MARLTVDEIRFLQGAGVPLSRVFDASGLSNQQYKFAMRSLGMWIAYGVTACQAAGHTLRTRAGHCAQCSPENISYLRRHDEAGEVYVAHSATMNLVKVGLSQDVHQRVGQLNTYGQKGSETIDF